MVSTQSEADAFQTFGELFHSLVYLADRDPGKSFDEAALSCAEFYAAWLECTEQS